MNTFSFNFAGKAALVTGGSSGIGKATSLLFAQHDAKVVIGDNNPAGLEMVETIKRKQDDAIFVQTDVSIADEVKNLMATTVRTCGGLHCAFNNAGCSRPRHGIRINALAPGLVATPMTKHWFDDSEIRRFFLTNTPIGRFATQLIRAREVKNLDDNPGASLAPLL